jgi:DNA-binding MarR family transcriptional regulator
MNKLNKLTPFVTSGKSRINVILFLNHSPKTPSWLANKTDTSIQNTSKILRQLLDKKIVRRYLSNARIKSKFYSLTDVGIEIAKDLVTLGYEKKE